MKMQPHRDSQAAWLLLPKVLQGTCLLMSATVLLLQLEWHTGRSTRVFTGSGGRMVECTAFLLYCNIHKAGSR